MTVIALNPPAPKKWDRVRTNGKTLSIAIVIELIIVSAVLFAGYQFAERYSGGDNMQWWMAIICGIVYAMVELARVPLAMMAAVHRRWYARWLAIFVLMFAVVITTKSLSQIGEQMFSQRLVEVHKAQTDLEIAEANNQGAIKDHASKLERIEALDAEIESFTKRLEGIRQAAGAQAGLQHHPNPPRSEQNLPDGAVTVGWRNHAEAAGRYPQQAQRDGCRDGGVRQGARCGHRRHRQGRRRPSSCSPAQPAAFVCQHVVPEAAVESNRR